MASLAGRHLGGRWVAGERKPVGKRGGWRKSVDEGASWRKCFDEPVEEAANQRASRRESTSFRETNRVVRRMSPLTHSSWPSQERHSRVLIWSRTSTAEEPHA